LARLLTLLISLRLPRKALNEEPKGSTPSGPVLSKKSTGISPAESTPNRKLEVAAQEQVNHCKLTERALQPAQGVKHKREIHGDAWKPTKIFPGGSDV
jgi:hypothetical protein